MTVQELADKSGWAVVAGTPKRDISSAYVCDLLSWVMSHGKQGTAWITVQTHLNVVAIASLLDFACIIIPEDIKLSGETIHAANKEGVCILSAHCSSYGAVKLLAHLEISEV